MKYIFIINPVAGKQKQQKQLIAEIRRILPAWQYELHFTTCPGDGRRLAARIKTNIADIGNIVSVAANQIQRYRRTAELG